MLRIARRVRGDDHDTELAAEVRGVLLRSGGQTIHPLPPAERGAGEQDTLLRSCSESATCQGRRELVSL